MGVIVLVLEKRSFYLAIELSFEGNLLLCFVRERVHVHALMTQKSCAVGMRKNCFRASLLRTQIHMPRHNSAR